ncbi:hypothetical protein FHX73_15126 [Kitasatospora viridis]|uniref:Uncharacterized protein n=1 Tax=Kitasatospora viridis TaxID=281105 RepID=A0A561SF54_9ACTN|nr:hypothetical protein FHX73_15126 [Kitasatospora viridis]
MTCLTSVTGATGPSDVTAGIAVPVRYGLRERRAVAAGRGRRAVRGAVREKPGRGRSAGAGV